MAAATNSTLGTVALAGDLAGTADAPELAPTGVKSGSYTSVSKMHIDSKGRIQWCGSANYGADLVSSMPQAASDTAGIYYIGPNININAGTISVNQASSTVKGIFKIGNNLEINQSTGALDVVMPSASASQRGIIQAGTDFSVTSGVLNRNSFLPATTTSKGMVQVGSGFNLDSGALDVNTASDTVSGIAAIDTSNFYLDTSTQTLYPHAANYMLYGMVFGWSSDFALDGNGKLTYTSPYTNVPATASTAGMVKIGSGINISPTDGTISIYPVEASASVKGLVEVGSGFNVASGVLSLDVSDSNTYGVTKIDTNYFTSVSGLLTAKDATTTSKGVVQAGSGIQAAGGVISVLDATSLAQGVVQVGSGFQVSSGTISVPLATAVTKGIWTGDGTMSMSGNTISLPDATTTSLGTIVSGQGFQITSGVLSTVNPTTTAYGTASYGAGLTIAGGVVNFTTDASASVKGKVQVGSGINISSDGNAVISVQDASASNLGIIQAGTDLQVSSGTISVNTATSSVKGVFTLGTSVTSNTISPTEGTPEAGTTGLRFTRAHAGQPTTPGVVREGDTNNLQIVNGVINTGSNVPLKNAFNMYSAAQICQKITYTSTDWSLGNQVELILTSNITSVPAPTNATAGQVLTLILRQDATGGRTLTGWNSVYKFQNGVAPTLSTAANAVDILTILCKSSTEFLVLPSLGYQ